MFDCRYLVRAALKHHTHTLLVNVGWSEAKTFGKQFLRQQLLGAGGCVEGVKPGEKWEVTALSVFCVNTDAVKRNPAAWGSDAARTEFIRCVALIFSVRPPGGHIGRARKSSEGCKSSSISGHALRNQDSEGSRRGVNAARRAASSHSSTYHFIRCLRLEEEEEAAQFDLKPMMLGATCSWWGLR